MVLHLGKSNNSYSSTWQDLQNALAVKYPSISKTKLRKIASANKRLFCFIQSGVQLYPLDHEFVMEYFELAQGVEIIDHQTDGSYSSSQPVHVHVGASILVSDLVCASSVSARGNAVLFKFGGNEAYRMENLLPGYYVGGQMLEACLRFRKFVKL
jgi:hypothetical protein